MAGGGGAGERGSGGAEEQGRTAARVSSPLPPGSPAPLPSKIVDLRLSFPGANPHPTIEPFARLDTHVSYFLGSDPAEWRPDVPVWGGVRYRDLYPGVDLEVSAAGGQWQWQLAASTPSPVATGEGWGEGVTLRVEGADAVALDGDALRLTTAAGDLTLPLLRAEPLPVGRSNVQRANVQRLSEQAFDVTTPFAPPHVSPQSAIRTPQSTGLIYGTYLGGSGEDTGYAIAVDAAGSAYVTGWVHSNDFPTTPGAFDTNIGGYRDAFVVKLDPAGSALAYATFLGGSLWDGGNAIAVDAAGSAYITGYTESSNFPTTPGAFDTSYNAGHDANGRHCNLDAFVVELDPAGGALAYASFLGGNGCEDGNAIAVDAAGSAYVTGYTDSTDFPTTPGAFDTSYNAGYDAFVVKLAPAGSALAYATFLGGSGWDFGYAIAVDGAGNAYATGYTWFRDFPTTTGAFDTSFNGGDSDAFAIKLNPAGSALAYATFLGGSDTDEGYAIAVDGAGNAYATGYTWSRDFPTTTGAFDTSFNGGDSDAFAIKLDATGSRLAYATFLGGRGDDWGKGIVGDGAGSAYVTGWTDSSDFPTTPGALDTSFDGGSDAFVVRLDPAGSALAYATLLGGSDSDFATGTALDGAGNAYVTGWTWSSDFPTTTGTFDASYNGYVDAFVAKLLLGPPPPPPAILGTVWHDLDGDGTRDPNEPGIAGVQVCAEPLGHRAVRCATTDADGSCTIELDAAGTYLVAPSAAPAGMRLTTPGFRLPVVVGAGQQVRNVDFGYR
ncbi:MAG: SBBP repeat-containing protein [Chloroflexi bacterium]|nr:SBBP repeat-containing protein [Chloroflexota bacterium]